LSRSQCLDGSADNNSSKEWLAEVGRPTTRPAVMRIDPDVD
jgi:hypothetical protein